MLERITLHCPICNKLGGIVSKDFEGTVFLWCRKCRREIAYHVEGQTLLKSPLSKNESCPQT